VAIWQHRKRVLGMFSSRMRRNSHLGTSGQKSEPAVRYGDLDFLLDRCISTTEWRLLDIFDVFVLLRRMALSPWPLTFWPWEWSTYQFLLSLRLLLTELRLLNIWSHFRYLKQSLRMRRVTWPRTRGKNSPHFWNPWPQFAYSLCHFQGATTKIKPSYRQKNSVFPLWRLQSLLHMRSITWPVHRRSPKTTRNNFLTPNCLFTIQLLCGTMMIKGSLYLSIPMLKRFLVQSKSVPKMAVFRKFKGPNIKYSHRDPQKALAYPERRLLTYFA